LKQFDVTALVMSV